MTLLRTLGSSRITVTNAGLCHSKPSLYSCLCLTNMYLGRRVLATCGELRNAKITSGNSSKNFEGIL
uniref:Uncharacterized protein n=1 Tax=Physcomitrium patens TaxID=3218 RepID=A0A2K1KXA8_PHYPA|nr:hypothetical protein PHYPA_005417 [Physcomitrium patens]